MLKFDDYRCIALRTPDFTLEPLLKSHAPELFAALSDPAHYAFIPQDPPASVALLSERYERWEARRSPDGFELWLNWLIRLPAGEAAGLVQATGKPDGSVAIAYELSNAFGGRGLATRAVHRMLRHLRDDAGFVTATALVDTRNTKSVKLLERLGFTRARFIKDADFFKGSPSDEYGYELDLRFLS